MGRSAPLWASWTSGSCTPANSCLAMQGDGNLVIYYPNGCGVQPILWQSGTGGHPGNYYCVAVQSDGNVVIYSPGSPCGKGGSYLTGANSPTWTSSPNTRSGEGADAWRTSMHMTRNTCLYPCRNANVLFRAIDSYSWRSPSLNPWVQNAVSYWNQSPTLYSFTPRANDTYNYIYASYPGDGTYSQCGNTLKSNTPANAIVYDMQGYPFNLYQATTIWWAEVCLNYPIMYTASDILNSAGQELGHTLGLAHNQRDSTSIMYPYNIGNTAPNSNDTGAPAPGCPNRAGGLGGLGGGSMCIYGWGD
jgi:hypothetical protein